jgi:predicted nucleotidyltransferase
MLILDNRDKTALINIFSKITEPIEIWAYGSRVNGSAHETSDLDLIIRTPEGTKLPTNVLSNLIETIKDSTIPIIIDLREWSRLPESFHQQILNNYEVFYSNISQ